MQKKKEGSLEWLEFDLLSGYSKLFHRIYLRSGGYSEGPFSSLNCSAEVGDSNESVRKNWSEILKIPQSIKRKAMALQCHGKKIVEVKNDTPEVEKDCDGLVTALPQALLMIKHADCQSAIFYDPRNHAVANIHCGWRGNVQNIYRETIQKMGRLFGTKASNLIVCISPSLGPEKAEFVNYRKEFPEEFWDYQVKPNYFDLWTISQVQLEKEGVLPENIEIARICTYSNEKDFFSYRRDRVTGRHATCVMLIDENCNLSYD